MQGVTISNFIACHHILHLLNLHGGYFQMPLDVMEQARTNLKVCGPIIFIMPLFISFTY